MHNVTFFFGRWTIRYDATDMSLYRSALSACVVRGLPNVQDYIYKPPLKEDRTTPTSTSAPVDAED